MGDPISSLSLPDDEMPHAVALPRRKHLFDCDSEDLMIIWDDWFQVALGFRASRSALQCVHNIFQPVVYIVKSESGFIQIQRDDQLQFVFRLIGNPTRLRNADDLGMDGFSPDIAWVPVGRNANTQALSSFFHIILLANELAHWGPHLLAIQ